MVMTSYSDTTKRFKIELAGVSFTSTSLHLQANEQRVCWRGRVLPKNFDLSQDRNRKLVQSSRSSRLLRTRNIQDIKVRSEVHELGEYIEYVQ
jgi:hypothetical protein